MNDHSHDLVDTADCADNRESAVQEISLGQSEGSSAARNRRPQSVHISRIVARLPHTVGYRGSEHVATNKEFLCVNTDRGSVRECYAATQIQSMLPRDQENFNTHLVV